MRQELHKTTWPNMKRIILIPIVALFVACPRPNRNSSSTVVASPTTTQGRALTDALNRVFADIYSSPYSAPGISGSVRTNERPAASAEVFHPYEKIASYYGFKAVASRQGARFYVHGKYLLGVLDNGRWGMSDKTLEPQRGGRLVAEGTSINSLEAWLKQNRL